MKNCKKNEKKNENSKGARKAGAERNFGRGPPRQKKLTKKQKVPKNQK